MKKIQIGIMVLLMIAASACKKDESTASNSITTDEAADMVASTLGKNSGGASSLFNESAIVSEMIMNSGKRKTAPECGLTVDTTVSIISPEGNFMTYSYEMVYGYELKCSKLGIPQTIDVTCDYTGQFETDRLSSTNSGKGTLTLSDIISNSASYKINGTLTRDGSFQSKVLNKNSSSSKLTITFTDVTIDKETLVISSGTASITLTGTVTGKGEFNFEASVAYQGNGEASIAIGDKFYFISLNSGSVD